MLDDADGMLMARLFTGLTDVAGTGPGLELWPLSRRVRASSRLTTLFQRCNDTEVYFELARAPKGSDAEALYRDIEHFLARYGHRGVNELELAEPNWREAPGYVVGMIRNYAAAGSEQNPQGFAQRQTQVRDDAFADATGHLNLPLRLVFTRCLAMSRGYVRMREETKEMAVRHVGFARRYLRVLAKKLVAEGRLSALDDVYFLTTEELAALAHGTLASPAASQIVTRRRREFLWCRQLTLPTVFEGLPVPVDRPSPLPSGQTLKGLGVCPGVVTGPARVILDPRTDRTIRQGEVLVAPVTDAGWMPLFLSAAALVVDVGGLLSHGSIVAREYGLPAVVNVKSGTQRIQTGQIITVNGNTGEVTLPSDA